MESTSRKEMKDNAALRLIPPHTNTIGRFRVRGQPSPTLWLIPASLGVGLEAAGVRLYLLRPEQAVPGTRLDDLP